jgi:RimJ/RimL family protein N-acetyltransferase
VELNKYSAMETLRGGQPIEIRALSPADRHGMLGALDRMSDESIRRRFFGPKRRFSEDEVAYYTNVDFTNHVALVAVLEEGGHAVIAGGARYIVSKPGSAEVAFAVDDAHQGQGIGALLMKHLAGIARRGGLQELYAEVLPHNSAMLKVFEKSGHRMNTKRDQGVVHVTLQVS